MFGSPARLSLKKPITSNFSRQASLASFRAGMAPAKFPPTAKTRQLEDGPSEGRLLPKLLGPTSFPIPKVPRPPIYPPSMLSSLIVPPTLLASTSTMQLVGSPAPPPLPGGFDFRKHPIVIHGPISDSRGTVGMSEKPLATESIRQLAQENLGETGSRRALTGKEREGRKTTRIERAGTTLKGRSRAAAESSSSSLATASGATLPSSRLPRVRPVDKPIAIRSATPSSALPSTSNPTSNGRILNKRKLPEPEQSSEEAVVPEKKRKETPLEEEVEHIVTRSRAPSRLSPTTTRAGRVTVPTARATAAAQSTPRKRKAVVALEKEVEMDLAMERAVRVPRRVRGGK